MSKWRNSIVVIMLFLCSGIVLKAQNYVTKNFTIKDGLPSNEVYCALQDNQGKIWFGTDAGISVFNGFYFKNYTIKDGLLDNSIFAMNMDEKGRIWFGSLNRLAFYFENGRFVPAVNKEGDTILLPRREILDIKVSKEAIYYCTSTKTFKIFEANNCFEMVELVEEPDGYDFVLSQIDEKQVCLAERHLTFTDNIINGLVNVEGYKKHYKFTADPQSMNSGFCTALRTDSCIILTSSKTIVKLYKNGRTEVTSQADEILKTKIIRNTFFTQTRQGGIKPYKLNDFVKSYSTNPLFDGFTITSYFLDRESGFWATSLENGVFYSTIIDSKIYTVNSDYNYNIVKLDTLFGDVWIISKTGGLMRLKELALNKKVSGKELISEGEIRNVNDGRMWDKYLVVSITIRTKVFEYDGKEFRQKKVINKPFRTLSNVRNGILYGGIRDSIYEIKNLEVKLFINRKFNEIFSIYNAGDSLLIGSNQGLEICRNGKLYTYPLFTNLKERVQIIRKNIQNTYIMGTKSSGVLFLYKFGILNLTTKHGLLSNNITDILCTNDSTTWVASKFGLSKIVITSNEKYRIENFNSSNGLLFDNITSLAFKNGLLYIGAVEGFFAMEEKDLKLNPVLPIITLDKIVSVKTNRQDTLFRYDNNDIKIVLSVSTFRNFGKIKARYKLKRSDTTYYYTTVNNGEITLLHLESGEYQFSIEVANNSGVWSKPLVVNFEIETPYWRKTWFIILCVFLLLVVGSMIFITRLRVITRRDKEKAMVELQLEELKNKALRLQMNPHFLFNALNSIQGYYASGDTTKAKLFIHNLSNLLRQILENTNKDTITLEMELQLIKYYMELNKLRLDKVFNYEISIQDGLLPHEILVPPLIMQPFLENAFVHALPTSDKDGLILVLVKNENELLKIEIVDNGVGRKEAEKVKRDLKHKSMGIQVTKDRIELANRKNIKSLEIIDLYEGEVAKGTKVIIRIPLNYYI